MPHSDASDDGSVSTSVASRRRSSSGGSKSKTKKEKKKDESKEKKKQKKSGKHRDSERISGINYYSGKEKEKKKEKKSKKRWKSIDSDTSSVKSTKKSKKSKKKSDSGNHDSDGESSYYQPSTRISTAISSESTRRNSISKSSSKKNVTNGDVLPVVAAEPIPINYSSSKLRSPPPIIISSSPSFPGVKGKEKKSSSSKRKKSIKVSPITLLTEGKPSEKKEVNYHEDVRTAEEVFSSLKKNNQVKPAQVTSAFSRKRSDFKSYSNNSIKGSSSNNNDTKSTAIPMISSDLLNGDFPTIITSSQPQIVRLVDLPGYVPQILCVCASSIINRYNITDGSLLQPALLGHSDQVLCLEVSNPFFAPNPVSGKHEIRVLAVSGGRDGEIRVWDLTEGKCILCIPAYTAPSAQTGLSMVCWTATIVVRLSGQVQVVSSGGEGVAVGTLSLANSAIVGTNGSSRRRASVRTGSGNSSLARRKVLNDLHLWDGLSGRKLQTFCHPVVDEFLENTIGDSKVTSLVIHQPLCSNSLLLSAGANSDIFVWDCNTNVLLCILRGHEDHITSLAISSFPVAHTNMSAISSVGTADDDIASVCKILDLQYERQRQQFSSQQSHQRSIENIVAMRTVVVSSSKDKTIRVWDLRKGRTCFVWTQHRCVVQSVSVTQAPLLPTSSFSSQTSPSSSYRTMVSPGTPLCLSVGDDGTVRVWDLATGTMILKENRWHQGLSVDANLIPTNFFRSIHTLAMTVNDGRNDANLSMNHGLQARQQKVLIATCALNNSVQCHELQRHLLQPAASSTCSCTVS